MVTSDHPWFEMTAAVGSAELSASIANKHAYKRKIWIRLDFVAFLTPPWNSMLSHSVLKVLLPEDLSGIWSQIRLSAGYVLSHGLAENGTFAQILSHTPVLFYESHASRDNPSDKRRDYSTREQALDLTHGHRESSPLCLGFAVSTKRNSRGDFCSLPPH